MNKQGLFHFLAGQLGTVDVGLGQMLSKKGEPVVCTVRGDGTSDLSSCNHEEADTRLLLYAADATKFGFEEVMLRTVELLTLTWEAWTTYDEVTEGFQSVRCQVDINCD